LASDLALIRSEMHGDGARHTIVARHPLISAKTD
jgi:hypothetical protein